ncbi:hypothetical protein SAMN05216215_101482 [Saccharopolyspora shandongensis]|uniref:Oxidoreductase molybdopterin binding domain-containing protein n=1 Tax=Saccharopolyspora shandongensis TaxID=418495 RepID=A0A1H3E3D3_9PSEU|nr:molybdopterin-binding protein [Saccharopolyspora shandongensis]SDX73130.1 hypothetical protein SAMN05216215_101482 [Saccharopolyspora shandongensis]
MEQSPFLPQQSDLHLVQVPPPGRPLRSDQLLVTGDIVHDWVIVTADLHAHAREPVNVRYVTRHAQEVHHVQGVPLHQLLARVSLRRDGRRKKDHLSFVVLARSEDDYQVVLSWAEIAPDLGACAALLATRYNGRLLTRPTLVVPHDGQANRYVRGVCRLQLVRVG